MSVFIDIDAALSYHLNSMVGLPAVAWENKRYEPVKGTPFIQPTNLPTESIQSTLGDSGTDENGGIYQVDIFTEANKGKKQLMDFADLIADHFKRGTNLTYNTTTVRIKSVSLSVANVTADGWYQSSVEINYISFTNART